MEAHRGAVLCLAAEGQSGAIVTGGDDGRFLRLSPDGSLKEIASFGTRLVDCVAAGPGLYACSSSRTAHVWRSDETTSKTFEHPSTVGGLAFDTKGRRLAVAHYGGATVWERGERRWKATKLVWKGSHGAVTFSPDGKYVATSTQENALHGWRLRDKADMRMSGYPTKVKSFAWVGTAPFLATSGADEAVCWPFDTKDGPMGRPPQSCAYGGKQLCTAVSGLVGLDGVFAGFADGCVLAGRPSNDGSMEDMVIKGSSGTPVSALAITPDGWLFVGDEAGRILWVRLDGGVE
ncbi:MAG: WD40 repeat domain-containing protein [Pseudomonadota bacterium]